MKAFSLIEIIIVVTVVGLIILVLSNLPSSFGLIGSGGYETIARQIAQKRIDDLRVQTYDNLANGTVPINDVRLNELPSSAGSTLIQDCPQTICTGSELVKQITITIDWKESGKNKNVKIDTLISKGGLN